MASEREKELEAILRKIVPAMRDILWCGLVWNDHNFGYDALFKRAKSASDSLGFDRRDGVDHANEFLERIDKALASPERTGGEHG